MHILFVPNGVQWGNPYQHALAEALSYHNVSIGIEVDFRRRTQAFCILRAKSRIQHCGLMHLHWTEPFLVSKRLWLSIVKSSLFLFELAFLKLLGMKLVWTVHNIGSHEGQHRRINLFFNRLVLHLCNHVIVHCESAWHQVAQTYNFFQNIKVTVIPHGHYLDYYKNKVTRPDARNGLKIGREEIVFLFFGAVRPYKGISQLVEAFKKLKGQQIRLLVVGSPITQDVGRRVQEKCKDDRRIKTVLEFVPDDQIQNYMNASDVVAMPFRDILTSGSVILAMGFAKAIIAPKLGCIPEILNKHGAILYDPDAKDGLREALEEACQLDLERMGRYNLNRANELDWNKIGKMTYEVYRKCLGNPRRKSVNNSRVHSSPV